jgi:cell wall-associated NlpC family hydrolase
VDFDYVLHSLIVAKRRRTPGWWHRPTTIGAVTIVALSATAAAASSISLTPSSPPKRAVARTYTASNWPDLLQRPASSGTSPSTPSAVVPAPTGPVVGAVDLCNGANEPPNAALTGDPVVSNGATHQATVVVTGVATQSSDASGPNSLLPTITGATTRVTGALGLTIPSLPSIPPLPDPTGTVPPTTPLSGGGGAAPSSGTAAPTTGPAGPARTPTSTTTTSPTNGSPPSPGTGSPLPTQMGAPSRGGSDSSIGCNLLGSGTVGGMAPGETAAESWAVANAIALLGLPYAWGGESTQTGFDCSGMVQYVYREVGMDLPRVAQNQYDAGPAVPPGSTVEPGDLVFFGGGTNDVSHVGMYVGDGLMIDAPHTGSVVRFDRVAGFERIVGVTAPGQR